MTADRLPVVAVGYDLTAREGLRAVVAADPDDGDPVQFAADPALAPPGVRFLAWLTGRYPHAWPADPLAADPPAVRLVGFDPGRLLAAAALAAVEADDPPPPAVWAHPGWAVDLGELVARLARPRPAPPAAGWGPADGVRRLARAAEVKAAVAAPWKPNGGQPAIDLAAACDLCFTLRLV